jgi:hypothetical protein
MKRAFFVAPPATLLATLLGTALATACGGGSGGSPDSGITDPPRLDGGRPVIDPAPPGTPRSCGWDEPDPPADPLSGAWDRRFALPGLGGQTPGASALAAMSDGALVVGGEFATVGELRVRNIALWHPDRGWSALGDGLPQGVTAVAVRGTRIFAAHRGPGGFPPDPVQGRLLEWNGTAWRELGAFDGEVDVIEVAPDGALYVGGWFSDVNGVAVSNVAIHRDGDGWSAFDAVGPDGAVEAILIEGDDVCLGGYFQRVGELDSLGVACRIDGTWEARPLPYYGGASQLLRDPSDGTLVAVGHFSLDELDSEVGGSVARWRDGAWRLIGGGLFAPGGLGPGYVTGAHFLDGVLHVAGAFGSGGHSPRVRLESVAALRDGRWDHLQGGVRKRLGVSLGNSNVLDTTVDSAGRLIVGGIFSLAGTQSVIGVAAWDGAYWRGLGAADARPVGGINGNVEAMATMGRCALYLGGSFEYAGDVRANNVVRFDPETGWHPLGQGLPTFVVALAVTDRIPAVGPDFSEGATVPIGGPHGALYAATLDSSYQGQLLLWDGRAWREMGSFDGPVFAIAVDDDGTVVVGGDFTRVGEDQPASRIARWDGFGWRPLGGGLDGGVRALHFLEDGRLLVGGTFGAADGVPAGSVAVWDGARWEAVGEGLRGAFGAGTVESFAFIDDQLYAGGDFESSDGRAMHNVARFDGARWQAVGDGLPGLFVQDLAVVGDTLLAAGFFDVDGEEHTIAALVGGAWQPFASDTDDLVMAIEPRPEGLYFAGPFINADERPSVGIALFRYAEVGE